MKRYAILTIMCIAIWVAPDSAWSDQWQDLTEQKTNGIINWSKGVIQAKGVGAPPERYYGKPQARPFGYCY